MRKLPIATRLAFEWASSDEAMASTQARAAMVVSLMSLASDHSKVDVACEATDQCSELRKLTGVGNSQLAH